VPVPADDPPAPATITDLVKCGCGRPTAGPTVPAGLRISTVLRCVCMCVCVRVRVHVRVRVRVCVELMKRHVVTSVRMSWG